MLFSNAINRKASFNLPAWTSLIKKNLKSQGPLTFQQCITGTDCSLSCYWEMLVQFMFISSFSSHLMPPKPRMCRGWKVPLSVIAHKLHKISFQAPLCNILLAFHKLMRANYFNNISLLAIWCTTTNTTSLFQHTTVPLWKSSEHHILLSSFIFLLFHILLKSSNITLNRFAQQIFSIHGFCSLLGLCRFRVTEIVEL